jgi:6-pyruvoyltetrahydropterin/6-carboxytetrahydropterin synthase
LLPTQHPQLKVEDNGREVVATLGERRWIFPSGDCRLLPMPNTTAEMLAAHIGRQLIAALGEHGAILEHVRIEIDECDGQIAVWEQ